MDLGDPGTASDPLGLFCARLKRLQTQSGIKQAGLLGAAGLKRSQVSDILNSKIERPPDWGITIAIVRACLEHAKADGRLVPPDLSARSSAIWVPPGVEPRGYGTAVGIPTQRTSPSRMSVVGDNPAARATRCEAR